MADETQDDFSTPDPDRNSSKDETRSSAENLSEPGIDEIQARLDAKRAARAADGIVTPKPELPMKRTLDQLAKSILSFEPPADLRQTRQPESPEDAAKRIAEAKHKRGMQRCEQFAKVLGHPHDQCRFANFVADTPAKASVLARVKEFATNYTPGRVANLLLCGPEGTGKDHLMTAAGFRVIYMGASVQHWSGADLFAANRDRIGSNVSESEFLDRLLKDDVLMISDPVLPGETSCTPPQMALLKHVVEKRSQRRRSTWMTVNVETLDEADVKLSPQVVGRMCEDGVKLILKWKSYRRTKPQ